MSQVGETGSRPLAQTQRSSLYMTSQKSHPSLIYNTAQLAATTPSEGRTPFLGNFGGIIHFLQLSLDLELKTEIPPCWILKLPIIIPYSNLLMRVYCTRIFIVRVAVAGNVKRSKNDNGKGALCSLHLYLVRRPAVMSSSYHSR